MKKLNQTGSAIVIGLLALLLVVAVGGVGFYVFKTQSDKKDTKTAQSSPDTGSSSQSGDTTKPTNSGYLEIKEMGIKVSIADADKLEYTYAKNQELSPGNKVAGLAKLQIKQEFLKGSQNDCLLKVIIIEDSTPPGVGGGVLIGGKYYSSGGSDRHFQCKNSDDQALGQKINDELDSAAEYFIKAL